MAKKKISEFATVTPSSTDKFLVEQADGTYKSVLASAITTGTTPDGLSSGGAITVGTYGGSGTNNDIRVAPASWYISPDNYSTAINTDFLDIALSSSGLQRYIGLYGTTSNTITKVEGSEAALATYPTTPANSIVIGYVLVNDASASTTPDLSGYLLKLDKATQSTNTTGTNDTTYVTPLSNAVKENTANKSTNVNTDQSSNTKFPSVKAVYDWAIGLFTTKANNLSDLASAKTARVNIGLDKRTTFGNVDYSALITDREIVTSVAFTAPRTVTLIAGLNAGAEIIVADEFQTVTSTNTLTIAVPTGKTLNGVLNGTEVISAAGSWRRFFCDGSDNYIFDAGIARLSMTQTLSNKRITPRITTITSSATPTINTDNCDCVTITALATAITSMTTNLTGTPANFDKLIFRIKDNGTARAITWGASFEAKGTSLPTTTTLSKVLTVGFIYDSVTAKWGCVASVNEI